MFVGNADSAVSLAKFVGCEFWTDFSTAELRGASFEVFVERVESTRPTIGRRRSVASEALFVTPVASTVESKVVRRARRHADALLFKAAAPLALVGAVFCTVQAFFVTVPAVTLDVLVVALGAVFVVRETPEIARILRVQ